ncbi:hypothetical protein DFP73DRAFT_563233 [Morchella snyderi]|nr:hypothetical protein DFP73DRAFT_563233 [Morchella snyderi]
MMCLSVCVMYVMWRVRRADMQFSLFPVFFLAHGRYGQRDTLSRYLLYLTYLQKPYVRTRVGNSTFLDWGTGAGCFPGSCVVVISSHQLTSPSVT